MIGSDGSANPEANDIQNALDLSKISSENFGIAIISKEELN
tara:strand:+ start:111 stop:233 length:123 start_codon:yes stop_codon:yes gene_type:complete